MKKLIALPVMFLPVIALANEPPGPQLPGLPCDGETIQKQAQQALDLLSRMEIKLAYAQAGLEIAQVLQHAAMPNQTCELLEAADRRAADLQTQVNRLEARVNVPHPAPSAGPQIPAALKPPHRP